MAGPVVVVVGIDEGEEGGDVRGVLQEEYARGFQTAV